MEFQEAIDIIKARVTKYFKREGTPGKYKYFYTEAEYREAKNENKPIKQTETKEFKEWFGNSKVVDDNGKPLMVFSGHANAELYGAKFDPKKGTSGGFYASEDPEIASVYALGKMGNMESYSNGSQYKLGDKSGNLTKKLWQIELTDKQKAKLDEISKLKDDNDEYVYPLNEMKQWAAMNKNHDVLARRILSQPYNLQLIYDYNESAGYNISYLKPKTSKDEPEFLRQDKNDTEKILDELGIKWSSYLYSQPAVMPLYLSIQNPIDADEPFPQNVLDALKRAAKGERQKDISQTQWTKDYPLKQFIKDIEEGDEYWTTQVPKKALDVFKQYGYDGIKERGEKGKNAPRKERRINWIAFEPTQIKSSIGNSGKFDKNDPDITKSMENLKGGKADNTTLEQIAKKHDVSIDKLKKQFIIGFKIEREHTKDPQTIKEIILDHLFERPDYYTKLETIEKSKKDNPKQVKIKLVMDEFKQGKLKDSAGNIVTNRKQAIAIAISEAKKLETKIEKSNSGIYKDTQENKEQGRSGMSFGSAIHGGKLTQLEGHKGSDLHYKDQVIEWFRAAKPFAWVQNKLEMYGVQDAEKYLRKVIDENYDKIME